MAESVKERQAREAAAAEAARADGESQAWKGKIGPVLGVHSVAPYSFLQLEAFGASPKSPVLLIFPVSQPTDIPCQAGSIHHFELVEAPYTLIILMSPAGTPASGLQRGPVAAATPLVEPSSEIRRAYLPQGPLQTPASQRPAQQPATAAYSARGTAAASAPRWASPCGPSCYVSLAM